MQTFKGKETFTKLIHHFEIKLHINHCIFANPECHHKAYGFLCHLGKFHKARSVITTATVLIWPDGLLWDVACSLLGFHWAVYLLQLADIHMEITGDYYRLLENTSM